MLLIAWRGGPLVAMFSLHVIEVVELPGEPAALDVTRASRIEAKEVTVSMHVMDFSFVA